jgi:hypothetical protein
MGNSEEPNFTPWLECKKYVFHRHMLSAVKITNGKLVANTADLKTAVSCTDALDWLYGLLSAMDSKASALMRLNGVMLAAAAFLLSMYSAAAPHTVLRITKVDEVAIVVTAALSSISILMCLFVVNVSWYFLGKVTEVKQQLDYTEEFQDLQSAAKFRQASYMRAWRISFLAAVLFVLEFARQSLYVMFGWGLW